MHKEIFLIFDCDLCLNTGQTEAFACVFAGICTADFPLTEACYSPCFQCGIGNSAGQTNQPRSYHRSPRCILACSAVCAVCGSHSRGVLAVCAVCGARGIRVRAGVAVCAHGRSSTILVLARYACYASPAVCSCMPRVARADSTSTFGDRRLSCAAIHAARCARRCELAGAASHARCRRRLPLLG